MNVELRGMEQTRRLLAMVPTEATKTVVRELRRSTLNVQAGAKRRAPVDTGRLRNSIATAFEREGLVGIVGTNVEYAKAVEFGFSGPVVIPAHDVKAHTRKRNGKSHSVRAHTRNSSMMWLHVKAQPFLHPAFEEEWPKFVARLRAVVGSDAVRADRV
jgi:phage gpG-like protein